AEKRSLTRFAARSLLVFQSPNQQSPINNESIIKDHPIPNVLFASDLDLDQLDAAVAAVGDVMPAAGVVEAPLSGLVELEPHRARCERLPRRVLQDEHRRGVC